MDSHDLCKTFEVVEQFKYNEASGVQTILMESIVVD